MPLTPILGLLVWAAATLSALAQPASSSVNPAVQHAMAEIERWQSCMFDFAAQVAPDNDDPAPVIAQAALAICMRSENTAFEAMTNYGPMELRLRWRRFVTTDLWPDMRKNMEAKVVAAALAARSRSKHQLR